jgi:hypothetical protein
MRTVQKHLPFISLVIFILASSIFFYYVSPDKFVETLGLSNGYLVSFLVAFFASISTFINFPYQLIIIALASGGLNPYILGLTAGAGEILGDSTSYLLGYHSHQILPNSLKKPFIKFTNWCVKSPPWATYIALFLYGAFIPLPNDLIILPLAVGRYPYRRIVFPLAFGNIFFNIGIALLGAQEFLNV